jgi:hypothetical protein
VLFLLLLQYIFPRRAPWWLAALALVSGVGLTLLLLLTFLQLAEPTMDIVMATTTIPAAFHLALTRAALPEEAVKAIAALLVLLPFRHRVTPAQAFQVAVIAASGFALVENHGYAKAFNQYALLIAFGRGFIATTIHGVLAMIFGFFLARFVATGWRRWHLPVIGFLLAVVCHAFHDTGLIPIAAEFLKTKEVDPEVALRMLPVVALSFPLTFGLGLWSLRRAIRNAAADDPLALEPTHQAVVRRWRWTGTALMIAGSVSVITAIAAGFLLGAEADDLTTPILLVGGFLGGLFVILAGWVVRQKR